MNIKADVIYPIIITLISSATIILWSPLIGIIFPLAIAGCISLIALSENTGKGNFKSSPYDIWHEIAIAIPAGFLLFGTIFFILAFFFFLIEGKVSNINWMKIFFFYGINAFMLIVAYKLPATDFVFISKNK